MLREFYDAHGDAPDELAHGQRRGPGLAAAGPGQVQRSSSASQGYGGRGLGGRALSSNARGRRAQQAVLSPGASARARVSGSQTGPGYPSVARTNEGTPQGIY
jgi:hypothetical protein